MAAPTSLSKLMAIPGIGSEKANRYGDAIVALCRSDVNQPRPRPTTPDPTVSLTPAQQLLDAQLRAWRKSEAERIGLPQFFVLGSSTLRSIVLLRPNSLAQLQSISGIGPEKTEKIGAAILALCNASLSA